MRPRATRRSSPPSRPRAEGLVSSTRLRGPLRDPHVRHEPHDRRGATCATCWTGSPVRRARRRAGRRRAARRADAPIRATDVLSSAHRGDLRAGRARRAGAVRVAGRRAARACRAAGRASCACAPGERVDAALGRARDFYVILEGRAVVDRDGKRLRRPAARGDFFGELAALDWGAGFGYARLATVTATAAAAAARARPRPPARLMAENPDVDEQVRRAVRERLPTTAD